MSLVSILGKIFGGVVLIDKDTGLPYNAGAGGGGGTQYTEDAAAAADPQGTMQMLVRRDNPGAETSADGDVIARRGTDLGEAYSADLPVRTSLAIMDDWDETDRCKVNIIAGQAGVAAGAGAVSATTQRMTLASDDPLVTAVSASIGYDASVTITRPADTAAYAANDVIGASTGSTACQQFSNMGPSGGRITITSVSLEIDAGALISGETSYVLHLYNATAPSALGDNAAFDLGSGDRASYLGSINLGTPVDLGSTLYVAQDGINKQIKLSGTSLFGYLVTTGPYTPTASRVHVVKLNAVSL